MLNTFTASPVLLYLFTGILGLAVGSFLNVVVYRLPLMLQRAWQTECRQLLKLLPEKNPESFNLFTPVSHCPHCKQRIKPWHNIPVLSFILLHGKCASCKRPIHWRYPVLELLSGVLSVVALWHFGATQQLIAALFFTWCLLALTWIDLNEQILPDIITLPLVWLGLLLSVPAIFINSHTAIFAAVAGYGSLWLLAWLFHIITGKVGMGNGDFKLLAAIGAWTGWQVLPLVVLLAALGGTIVGCSLIFFKKQHRSIPISFGPYLAAAGWIALLWKTPLLSLYWRLVS